MDDQLLNPQPPAPETESEAAKSADEILRAPIWSLLVKLSFPAVIGLMIVGLNNFVDALYVGRLISADAVAALTMAFPLVIFVWGFASMLGEGAASMLSRAIGRRDNEERDALLINVMALTAILSAVLIPISWISAPLVINSLTETENIRVLTLQYFRVFVLGLPFVLLGASTNMMIRAEGKLARAMVHSIATIATNVVLNPVLIAGADLGMGGAALATVMAMVVYMMLNLRFLRSQRSMSNPKLATSQVQLRTLRRIATLGTAGLVNNAMGMVQQVLLIGALTTLGGAREVALFGAAWRLLALPLFAVYGLVRALQPVLGMNYGAGQFARVRESVIKFAIAGTGLLVVIWLPIIIDPEPYLAWTLPEFSFTDTDINRVRALTMMLPALPAVLMGMTMFQALGYAGIATSLSIGRQLILFVPAVWLLPKYFGVSGVFYTLPAVDAVMVVVSMIAITRFLARLSEAPQPA